MAPLTVWGMLPAWQARSSMLSSLPVLQAPGRFGEAGDPCSLLKASLFHAYLPQTALLLCPRCFIRSEQAIQALELRL